MAPFNAKAKKWTLGQDMVWQEIDLCVQKKQKPIIWMHCASYGEFEQGLPIIENMKKEYPQYQIWLTFFSPSGYLHRQNDPSVDFITYLPLDSAQHAKRFFDLLQPVFVIFVKYEFWHYYLSEAKRRNIPTVLVAASFRPNQLFFKWYGGFYKKMIDLFYAVLVQDENSKKLIAPIISESKIVVTGDTRFDRVWSTAQIAKPFEWLHKLNQHKIIIAGSTWEKDHILLAKLTEKFSQFNWIIVPHHVDTLSIQKCLTHFNNATTLSSFIESHQKFNNAKVIIIDQMGLLRSLYQYAFVTYIGGGFDTEGIHNVLEPAAFGKPVIWGPNDEKYREAIGLVDFGGGFKIHDENSFKRILNILIEQEDKYNKACAASVHFIQQNAGATQKTMQFIQENRLLTN